MAVDLCAFLYEKVGEIPDRPYRSIAQILDSASSISANIPVDSAGRVRSQI